MTTLSNGAVVAVGSDDPGGALVETSATTAAPASAKGSVASGVLPDDGISPPAAAPTAPGAGSVVLGVLSDGAAQGPSVVKIRR